jgi:two-component system chemotaxis sensor kinase CheA
MDAILDGLAEVSAQLGGLRGSLATVERVHRLTDLLAEQAANGAATAGRAGARVAVLADELRQLTPRLERSLSGGIDRLERELRQVREGAERLRLVAASSVFVALERVARDAAVSLGKRVELDVRGGDVRLDGHVLALVQRALVQLVRNAVAHGVEAEPARRAAGKPPSGRIHVEARRTGKRVAFICADDGAGIDLDAVRRKAGERAAAASDDQLIDLLLAGGISTSATVTEAAGRGVGLDVAREIAARLGGVLTLSTTRGQGTRVELTVPVSMTSLDVLCVAAGGVTAAIPLDSIRHATRLAPADVVRSAAGEAFRHDGEMLPFLPLAGRLGHRASTGAAATTPVLRAAVVVQAASGRAVIGVEHLLGTANVVLRPLPALAPTDALVAGASLDDLGDPQLVLDPDGLVEAARHAPVRAVVAEPARPPILVIDDSLTTRMLEQSILEAAGYRVDLASSAEEGLEKARQKDYGLFLVDVEMPGMDGFSFVQTTRADAELRKVPAILVTSRDAPEDRQRGADAGARGYVVKGEFEQTALLDTIKRLVRSA